ncbi:5-formyltetrahydrofolate cyclo-ligase [Mesoplasma florum]|uniref:5-formyltetrahydrofolate cyclo-ligase n=1 Tax=Mesoplasma florum TaxID=2151 RepID=UPI000BE3892B|nr:5-formyltetrahydrofolate cyclo-ligase [Mesoplasma florum]ATI73209.1 5-formyltetrahydrofolate cyclo-ligase [Mesoplasma florum]ATI73896.1 5-formyltetrahydrofolate cyclo-ligase [Mesoplasma florum]AVN61611.1 5-formyltetrahydrofolate cyclo-ligase [Mesoplasma florum]AVN64994.1 5-formyltetrahydrofolate cyclo-ligase [Mesoplasma florum]
MSNKNQIREKFLKTRSFLSKSYKEEVNKIIERKVNHYIDRYNLEKYAIYLSTENEPNTLNIIETSLKKGIEVYVPLIIEDNKMEFKKITNLETDLEQNKVLNILQPKSTCPTLEKGNYINTMFIPLVAFDKQLNRVGMGKGFYDRWLNENDYIGYKIGLSASTQLSNESIDADEFDVKLDNVITEKEIYVPFVEEEQEFDYDVTYSVFNDETIVG